MSQKDKLLSICIPAYNRSKWFERALRSIVTDISDNKKYIQVIISDDSESDECRQIAQKILNPVNIQYKYVHNRSRLGMAANWNYSIQLASGKYVLVLHDDDFLLHNAVEKIIEAINNNQEEYAVMLFGVHVVNEQEKIIKKQLFKSQLYLDPEKALLKALSNSSFIRFPGIVICRKIFKEVGYFNAAIGEVADLDMWIRILSKYGLFCLSNATSAYTVHSNALTTGMFNEQIIEKLLSLFSEVEKLQILPLKTLEKSKANFFHQFILAGTFRKLKNKQIKEFNQIMELFNHSSIIKLNPSIKWLFMRIFFEWHKIFIKFILLNISCYFKVLLDDHNSHIKSPQNPLDIRN